MKTLLLSSPNPTLSEYVAYTGLFRCFGTNAVDFPCLEKVWLPSEGWLGNESRESVDRTNIREKLANNFFDLILVSVDAWEEYAELLRNKENVCLLDGRAGGTLSQEKLKAANPVLYLKGECLAGQTNSKIVPFSLACEPLLPSTNKEAKGGADGSILVSEGGRDLANALPELASRFVFEAGLPSVFLAIVAEAGISAPLSFWRALAAGVPLFALRPKAEIPNLPREGVEVVYFDGIGDLRVKLRRYLEKPELLVELGKRGKEAFLRNHTCSARVESFISRYIVARTSSYGEEAVYQTKIEPHEIFDAAFLEKLLLTNIAEFCQVFPDAPEYWKRLNGQGQEPVGSDLHPSVDWKSVFQGHVHLLKEEPIRALKEYEKSRLDSFSTQIIKGICWAQMGNFLRANKIWFQAKAQNECVLVLCLIAYYLEGPKHPERTSLFPLLKGFGLEIGCGARKTVPEATGIDLLAKGEIGVYGVVEGQKSAADYRCSGDNIYFLPDGSVDYIIQRHNLEHYQDVPKAIAEWSRLLKPGGLMGFVVPDDENLDTIKLDETHKHVFTRDSMKRLVALFPELELVHLGTCLHHWSFLAVIQKKGGKPFNYAEELGKCEAEEALDFLRGQTSAFPLGIAKDGLLNAWEISGKSDEVLLDCIEILVKYGQERLVNELLNGDLKDAIDPHLAKARLYSSLGKVEMAERILQRVERKDGRSYSLLSFQLSDALGKKEEAFAALSALLAEVVAKPEHVQRLYELAVELKREGEALEVLGKAPKAPTKTEQAVWLIKARLLVVLGKDQEAVSILQRFLAFFPEHYDTRLLLDRILGLLR